MQSRLIQFARASRALGRVRSTPLSAIPLAVFTRGQQTGTPFPTLEPVNVVDHIIMRHKELRAGLEELASTPDPDRRKELLYQVTRDLSVHAAVEELVVYSAAKRELGDVDPDTFSATVFDNLEEHHAAKAVLSELYSMGVKSDRFPAKAKVLMENVILHMKKEEEKFLPELAKQWDPERLMAVGEEFKRAEKNAPTRPHPLLPDEGMLGAAAQNVASLVDRLRDAARDAISSTNPPKRE